MIRTVRVPRPATVLHRKLRYSYRRYCLAADTKPVVRARPCLKHRVFAGRSGRCASRDAVAKATYAGRPFSASSNHRRSYWPIQQDIVPRKLDQGIMPLNEKVGVPTDLDGAARDDWLGTMALQACNEERRSECLFSWADRRAVRTFC